MTCVKVNVYNTRMSVRTNTGTHIHIIYTSNTHHIHITYTSYTHHIHIIYTSYIYKISKNYLKYYLYTILYDMLNIDIAIFNIQQVRYVSLSLQAADESS